MPYTTAAMTPKWFSSLQKNAKPHDPPAYMKDSWELKAANMVNIQNSEKSIKSLNWKPIKNLCPHIENEMEKNY